jgi:PKD repeat protein
MITTGKGLLYLNSPIVKQMEERTGVRYLVITFCIICVGLVSVVNAGCGINPNPFDPNASIVTGNGYFPPVADFSGELREGYAPLEVSFTDKSTNNPTYWVWGFGDGLSSNNKNPVHNYILPGIYAVTLTAGNGYGGSSMTKANYIVVSTASSTPVVDFTANVTSGNAPLQVEFTDLSTGGTITSRVWTFSKDGSSISETTAGQKLVHSFSEAGQYNVTLTVMAENNNIGPMEKDYYISVIEPVPEEGIIMLHKGWNLVSSPLPLKEQYRTAGQVFVAIDTDSHSIYSYNAVSKQFIPLNSYSVIYPLEGIWVYSKFEAPLTFSYQVTRPVTISMDLPSGWNLIGYSSTEPGNAREGFASLGNTWSTILCFDAVTQQYSSTIFNEGTGVQGDQQMMYPMNGYWIYMPREGHLVIATL